MAEENGAERRCLALQNLACTLSASNGVVLGIAIVAADVLAWNLKRASNINSFDYSFIIMFNFGDANDRSPCARRPILAMCILHKSEREAQYTSDRSD